MNNREDGKGIFFGVIGVATLVVAIIGATFAYFTATETAGQNEITGNAATISFGLDVAIETTVDKTKGGLIPMTDSMVEAAVNKSHSTACVDDNGNAVCQIYKVTIDNKGTASMFLDGYVNLSGGLGTDGVKITEGTNMRWAQVFKTATGYSISGDLVLANDVNGTVSKNITYADYDQSTVTTVTTEQTRGTYVLNGSDYSYISNNYMRVSLVKDNNIFTRANTESALVYNQYIAPQGTVDNDNNPIDEIALYFVVWLTETGTDQTPEVPTDSTLVNTDSDPTYHFFNGIVVFNSAQGGEVSATFGGFTRKAIVENQ